jgi:alpha-tubulin suppressor-like RCC1 family protein
VSTRPVAVSGGRRFIALAAGGGHTCGLTSAGAAFCWGMNTWGQLGDGSTDDRPTPVAVGGAVRFSALVTGAGHTCGLTGPGVAYCWGNGAFGQLGHTGYTGNDAHPLPTAVTGGLTFRGLASGSYHTCGLASSGAAYCWGNNSSGQLGDDGFGNGNAAPSLVPGGFSFRTLAPGGPHTCGLTSDGAVRCWGDNSYGQLGDGTAETWWVPGPVSGGIGLSALAAGAYHTCGVAGPGAAHCWGDNSSYQLGTAGPTSSLPVAVSGGLTLGGLAAGGYHTCALTSAGAGYCWGWNGDGELGNGDPGWYFDTPSPVVGNLSLSSVATGAWHSCGLASGAAYCWGWNGDGQLGDGSTSTRSSPVAVVGGLSFTALGTG